MSRNPYHSNDAKPALKKSVFVYMDILGYSQLISMAERDGTQESLFAELYDALSEGRKWLRDEELGDLPDGFLGMKDTYVLKAFTDNIVISWPIRRDGEGELGSAFFKLIYFQFVMTKRGFFIRGAISAGDAYVDDVAVFGSALNEAYKGETTLARDPRIILTDSAVRYVKEHLSYYAPSHIAPQVRYVLCDADGQWFVNYLECVLSAEDEVGPFFDELLAHKAAVELKLSEYKNDPSIFAKYAWVANYHNYFCDLHRRYFTDEFRIDPELFRAKPKSILEVKEGHIKG